MSFEPSKSRQKRKDGKGKGEDQERSNTMMGDDERWIHTHAERDEAHFGKSPWD